MGVYEENIVPLKISQLAEYVAKVKRIALDDALVYIYINPLYQDLYNENSKWWYLSTEALYREFERRRNKAKRTVSPDAFEFYTFCLEKYVQCESISGIDAWRLFKESGVDDYLINNYDLLHTQGADYLIDDINRFIEMRGKDNKNNVEKFDEEFDRIDAIRSASEDLREQRTFDIAVGGLTVSIGIFTYLVTHAEKIPSRWMIIAIMACFGLAVVLNYYSHILSTRSMEKILRRINAHKTNGDPFNAGKLQEEETKICKFGTVLNWVVSTLILAGVVMIVIYGIKYVLL